MNNSSKDGIVDALILKIQREQRELAVLQHPWLRAIEELSPPAQFIATDNAVINIHSFIQSYLATAALSPNRKIMVYLVYTTASSTQYRLEMHHDDDKGDHHDWNLAYFIGLFMKEALENRLRNWETLVGRLRAIADSLQPEATKIKINLRQVINQELLRHLSSLQFFYQKLVEHTQPDLNAHEELYEISYQWNQLCWKYELVEAPFDKSALYETS